METTWNLESMCFHIKHFWKSGHRVPNCHASVAICGDGKVVYRAWLHSIQYVRHIYKRGDGWRIGPLFADNSEIDRNLYREACGRVAAEDPRGIIIADIPYGDLVNPDALNIVKELSVILTFKCVWLYMKDIPSNMPLQKLFAITSLSIARSYLNHFIGFIIHERNAI